MTSEFNKQIPTCPPHRVIGTARRPNRRDLKARDNIRGLPDPTPTVAFHRTALELEQAALRMQQSIIEMGNESSIRDSLTVLADPEAPWSDAEWETESEEEEVDEEEEDREVERWMEDEFISKVEDVDAEVVEEARDRWRAARGVDPQAFARKVTAVRQRGARATATAAAPAPAPTPAPAPSRNLNYLWPGDTRSLTTAEAALELTNAQAGTDVSMGQLSTRVEIEDNEDTYAWTVGVVENRELTLAEAALVVTNWQAGTRVTMQDLRTAREMVDLWDCEDTFQWTVGHLGYL